ncbi:hypothetical protein KIN20_002580 [Parelaphostrongylus tenuis]|uniref:Uncharacterized protein n=1 Tax=Parelaphostrongylus tenuis TaxID=148309 RepID=A0AAD5MGV5_PARTN|nr:hypothetical protein KIN20_002580 [Parelaphostrongylus tenuis]
MATKKEQQLTLGPKGAKSPRNGNDRAPHLNNKALKKAYLPKRQPQEIAKPINRKEEQSIGKRYQSREALNKD